MAARVGLPYRIRAPLQWVGRNNKPPAKAPAADSIGEETWSPLQAPNYLRMVLTSKVYEATAITLPQYPAHLDVPQHASECAVYETCWAEAPRRSSSPSPPAAALEQRARARRRLACVPSAASSWSPQ